MATCSDPELARLITAYELGALPEEDQEAFERHLMECAACFEDLGAMEPVATILRQQRQAAEGGIESPDVRKAGLLQRFRGTWTVVVAGAAAAALAGVFAVWHLMPPRPEPLRGVEDSPLILYAPVGEVSLPERLDWKEIPGSAFYELRILDERGVEVWKESVKAPPLVLPEAVRGAMKPGRTYSWEMEAVSPDGTRLLSEPSFFTIRR